MTAFASDSSSTPHQPLDFSLFWDSSDAAAAPSNPTRAAVPEELKWDLELIYPSAREWEEDFARIENELPEFEAFSGRLHEPTVLLECLQRRDRSGETMGKVYAWASLTKAGDNADATAQERHDRATGLHARRAAATAFIQPQILELEPETLRQAREQEPELELYGYYFETLERSRPHARSSEVEEVLAQLAETRRAGETAFRMFDHADLKFPSVRDENGIEQELTHGKYINFLQSTDRRVREDAFRVMHGTFDSWKNTLCATLAATVKSHVAMSRIRHYPSVLHMELGPDAIPVEVYSNLLSTVRERLPTLHRYLRLRKRLMGLDELRMWDLYVPLVGSLEREVPIERGRDLVLRAASILGDEAAGVLQSGFQGRWIDWRENQGKTSGAFSGGSYLTAPYILMNYQDKLESVFTLAHEWGHSLHSFLARQHQPYVYAGYTIFVAEVASTLLEALLAHGLLEEARERDDRELQLFLLNQTAERFRTTLYRQTLFAEFELAIHEKVEANQALTASNMSEMYLAINRDYYGAEVQVDEIAAIEWARIPHFYYSYYVYQYATGISAAQSLARQILSEGQSAVTRYLDFLRAGGSKTSIELLQNAGVDMTTSAPIHAALDGFDETIAAMEQLCD